MPRTSKKSQITYKTIVPMKKSVQEPKKTQSRFGIWIVPRQWGCDTMTCTRLAGMILWCPEVQDAISSLAPSDIYIVSVVATATPWLFLATLSNWSTFNIDLSALVENQQLSLAWWTLTISEWNSVDLCPVIAYCITNNGLPDWVDLFSLNGTIITSGSTHNITIDSNNNTLELEVDWITVSTAPIINSNDLSNTWLAITSTVNGIADAIDITSDVQALITSNTDSVTNTVAGHLIAIHTAVDNTVVNINETITSTIAVGTWIQTTNEDGSTNIITFPIINAGTPTASMEVRVDGVLVTTIPLVQYDIQIDNAGSDFNLVDDQLTFLETNWDTATINFSKYNISASLVTGGIGIYQNGNLIATIPNTASWISIVDAWNYYTSSNVEWALQEIGSALNNTCSGNPLSVTNKLLTSDTLDPNTTVPTTVVATPDPTVATNEFVKAVKVNTGCNEDVYVPIVDLWCADLTPYQEGINTPPLLTKSVLWDQPWSVPTVINVNTPIEENPDRTVQKIETDWSKILIPFDPFYVDWSDQVFAKPTDVFIPSNATTDEFMMIDTATGQLKRKPEYTYKNNVEWFINVIIPRNVKTQLFSFSINNTTPNSKDYIISLEVIENTNQVELYNNLWIWMDIDWTQDWWISYTSCAKHDAYTYNAFEQYVPWVLTWSRSFTLTPWVHTIAVMWLTNFSFNSTPWSIRIPYVIWTIHSI